MSWLRNTSLSFARQLSRSLDPRHDYEPHACYSSFCKHWQQAHDIILKSQPRHLHDDVLGVVNHLEQLGTLLVLEARAREICLETSPAACLEHLLSENLLEKLYEWAICTGKYENAVRLEQLKLFGSLVSHYSSQVIAAEPFLRPLLKLLSSFRNELPPPNLENQLVTVLNQLCVALMQNMKFIDLFFLTAHTHNGSQAEFIIVRLLLTSVHREGGAGAVARDALLLCAKMSARCVDLAQCMLAGNTCVVLATGLSGLYSLLPHTIPSHTQRLEPDDVNRVHKLTLFIDSLEFCDAVAQVAHPSIKRQLLDLLYQGFLVPVMGPALLQTKAGGLQSGGAEQAAAEAYLELVLRCATSSGLLRPVLHFLLAYQYDGVRVVDVLFSRLNGNSQLSLVTLTLMETFIDLNCEDVMLELVFKHLLNGHHLMVNHRHQIADPEPYRDAAIAFLSLSPRCCARPLYKTREWADDLALTGRRLLDSKRDDDRKVNGLNGDIAMSSLVQEVRFNYGNLNESLLGNYHAYLCEARFEIVSRTIACTNWTSKYDAIASPKKEANNNTKEKEMDALALKEQESLISVSTTGYATLKTSDPSEKEPLSLTSLNEEADTKANDCQTGDTKEHDSLTSIGDSSGYDSFRYKADEVDEMVSAEESFVRSVKPSAVQYEAELPATRHWRATTESIIGPLLSSLLKKAAALLEADVATNCRVTGVLSKLGSFPTPLLTSLLLCPTLVLQPNVPSLYQILSKLKQETDELTAGLQDANTLVDRARAMLMMREMQLRQDAARANAAPGAGEQVLAAEAPFHRVETKRRSLSSSLSHMFGRRPSASAPSQQTTQPAPSSSKQLPFTEEAYWNQSITLRTILNAVILDEWVKELASLCEEHALRLSAENYEGDAYIRMVAL